MAGADTTHISLLDYPMPIYDGDLENRSGPPEAAIMLKKMMQQHQGIFIASPEYNASGDAAAEKHARLGVARA